MTVPVKDFRIKLRTDLLIDWNPSYEASILLAGTGRSGTTWVCDIINYRNEYRYIFEPFRTDKVHLPLKHKQYLRPDSSDKEARDAVKAILSGRVKNPWTDAFNHRFISGKRLIKAIRANLLLKWMQLNFPGMPMILLLRHPCAVANSQRQVGWNLSLDQVFLSQDKLVEDVLAPFEKEIRALEDLFERLVFLWCIETYTPLSLFRRGDIHVVFYEDLCVDPEKEIGRLFSYLGKQLDEKVFAIAARPSRQAREDSAIRSGESLTDSWRAHLSPEQVNRAVEILEIFGLERLYTSDSMPMVDAAEVLPE